MDYNTDPYLMRLLKMMEEKMIELMGYDAYSEWSKQAAKELFRLEIDNMEDSDFKRFCEDNFDKITSDGPTMLRFCEDNFDEFMSDEPMSGLYYWEDEDALGGTEDEA